MSLLAFLGGFGSGYVAQQERNRQNKREDMRDEMYAQRFAWEKEDAEQKRQDRADSQRLDTLQAKLLSEAGAPVEAYDVKNPPQVVQPLLQGDANYPAAQVTPKYIYTDEKGVVTEFTGADAKEKANNHAIQHPWSDEAKYKRVSSEILKDPKGLKASMDWASRAEAAFKTKLERDKIAKEIEKENLIETADAMRTGVVSAFEAAHNKKGEWMVTPGTTKVTKVPKKMPWGETVDTFTYTGQRKHKDGRVEPFSLNSDDASMATYSFREGQEAKRKDAELRSKLQTDAVVRGLYAAKANNENASARLQGTRASGQAAPQVGLNDRNKFLDGIATSIPDPAADINKTVTPEMQKAYQSQKNRILAKADQMFTLNAENDNLLTYPVALEAMELAKADPKNIKSMTNTVTGQSYLYVPLHGKRVIIDTAKVTAKK